MEEAKKLNTFISLHEEDPGLNGTLGFNENIAKEHFHICGATGVAEYAMIARDVMIAYATKAHVHIQHLSKEESVKVVEFAQGLGANVTAEVAPQHFSKTEALLLTKGSNAKMIHHFAWSLTAVQLSRTQVRCHFCHCDRSRASPCR